MNASDRSLVNAFRDVGAMADKLNLPKSIVVSRVDVLTNERLVGHNQQCFFQKNKSWAEANIAYFLSVTNYLQSSPLLIIIILVSYCG